MKAWIEVVVAACLLLSAVPAVAETRTWDGRHGMERLEVTVVYFVPADREPLPDWRDRVAYYCRRIEQFHEREFAGQSVLTTRPVGEPLVSARTTAELRRGDADAIFFSTLGEAADRLGFGQREHDGFPVLLVLSEINWRPLDDFYRVRPTAGGHEFEGHLAGGEHFPGAASGGSRAVYLADRGVGWGLVSADGWRVPYRGSDCVVYHEGCGHTVGLPHPEPVNGSVMSVGQYRGWLGESWLDREQKLRLGWEPRERPRTSQLALFSEFRALPLPRTPAPSEPVSLELAWPDGARVRSLRVRFQTAIHGPWMEVPQSWEGDAPERATLAAFERETPVSYRIDAVTADGSTAELWGYFQVRSDPARPLLPPRLSPDLAAPADGSEASIPAPGPTRDLLEGLELEACWSHGEWTLVDGVLTAPRMPGARLQLPVRPPESYRLVAIVEPLDPPDGLVLGQRAGASRFVSLFGFQANGESLSAIENVDGRNVGNETTSRGALFRQGQLSQVIVTVGSRGVRMEVDGRRVVDWEGASERLSLSDYWRTPEDGALFVGSYDCRYRFHRLTLEALDGGR
jgi:hypothetical protein